MNHLVVPRMSKTMLRDCDANRRQYYPNAPPAPTFPEPDQLKMYNLYKEYQYEFKTAKGAYTTECKAAGVTVAHVKAHNLPHVNKTLRYFAEEVALACLS